MESRESSGPRIHISHEDHDIVRNVVAEIPKDISVLVFGSRVTGKHKRFSDLDLCLRSKRAIPTKVMGDLREKFEESDLPFKVDIIDYQQITPEFRKVIDLTAVEFK